MPAVLTLLRIRNLALVEELEWQIGAGFVAVTGETGAGKSIIIGALQLLLGERADKSLIRTGADLFTVEAVFSGNDLQKLNPQLVEAGIGNQIPKIYFVLVVVGRKGYAELLTKEHVEVSINRGCGY